MPTQTWSPQCSKEISTRDSHPRLTRFTPIPAYFGVALRLVSSCRYCSLKRPASAVQSRPWLPHSKGFSGKIEDLVRDRYSDPCQGYAKNAARRPRSALVLASRRQGIRALGLPVFESLHSPIGQTCFCASAADMPHPWRNFRCARILATRGCLMRPLHLLNGSAAVLSNHQFPCVLTATRR